MCHFVISLIDYGKDVHTMFVCVDLVRVERRYEFIIWI